MHAGPAAYAPTLFWVTGLSGAGKTTVATLLRDKLAAFTPVLLFDGDVLRTIFGKTQSYDTEGRRELAHSYARLAQNVVAQGVTVVCATISMFHDVRAWNRANNAHYFEVYLRVPEDQLRARDPKGLYKKNAEDTAGGLVGIGATFEEPQHPDIVVENYGALRPEDAAAEIWRAFCASGKR
jgi:adenylylsulfate kinase